MKWLLGAALALSLSLNVWLLVGSGQPATPGRSGGPGVGAVRALAPGSLPADNDGLSGGGPVPPEVEAEALVARVDRLETELAAAEEKAGDAGSLDPLAFILFSRKPLAWKARRLLDTVPEDERWKVARKMAVEYSDQEGAAQEFLEVLSVEADPDVIALLGQVMGMGALARARPEERRAFGELVKIAALPAVRASAVEAVFMHQGFAFGIDEETRALGEEMNGILTAALYTETSPEVVGAIASNFADWRPSSEQVKALEHAAGRLPASPGRRDTWEAIGRGTFGEDRGAHLLNAFEQAASQDLRNDVAGGLARAANSMGSRSGGDPEVRRREGEEGRELLRIVYPGTTDPDVRRELTRGAAYGLGCIRGPLGGTAAGEFFRELAAMEPDSGMRGRLMQIAAAFEADGMGAYNSLDEILYAAE